MALESKPNRFSSSSPRKAIGVLEAAQAADVPVPERLSVIGFDNVEAAGYTGLTTVAQPLHESGALGAELLLRAMAGEPVEGRRLELEVVERGSTAAPGLVTLG
jgi:DNA-binding LacI/PurR family transcriptional regulator